MNGAVMSSVISFNCFNSGMGKPLSTSEIDIYTFSLKTCLKDYASQDDSKSSIIDKIILLKYNIFIENQLTA